MNEIFAIHGRLLCLVGLSVVFNGDGSFDATVVFAVSCAGRAVFSRAPTESPILDLGVDQRQSTLAPPAQPDLGAGRKSAGSRPRRFGGPHQHGPQLGRLDAEFGLIAQIDPVLDPALEAVIEPATAGSVAGIPKLDHFGPYGDDGPILAGQ